MPRITKQLIPSLLATMTLAGTAFGQCGTSTTIFANPQLHMESFGKSVAFSANGAYKFASGAHRHDTPGKADSGAAYVFERQPNNTWLQTAMLQANETSASGFFGAAVAMANPWTMVGEPGRANQTGAVHMFELVNGTWTHRQRIIVPGATASELCGENIAINGAADLAIIGIPDRDFTDNGQLKVNCGVAYVYRRTGSSWALEYTINESAADREFNDWLGSSVSISGARVAVGAAGDNINGVGRGTVEIHANTIGSLWVKEQEIIAPAGADFSKFGESVDLESDRLIVGAPDYDNVDGYTRPGAAFVYSRQNGTWVQDAMLLSPYLSSDGYFGLDVKIHGDTALVHAGVYGPNGDDAQLLYRRRGPGNWTCEKIYVRPGDTHSYAAAADLKHTGDGLAIAVTDATVPANGIQPGAVYLQEGVGLSASDQCSTAPLVGEGTYQDCTVTATPSASNTSLCVASANGNDVWYKYTAPCDTVLALNTNGSNYDTVLSVHEACGATSIACDDDSGTGTQSALQVGVAGGETVLIRIAGFNSTTGSVVLNVDEMAPGNDNCHQAAVITEGTFTGCTRTATVSMTNPLTCTSAGPDVWFNYTATCDGPVTISTQGSSFDTVLSLHFGCPGDLFDAVLACNDDFAFPALYSQLTINATQGTLYRFRLGGYGAADQGQFVLTLTDSCVEPTCPCDWNGTDGLDSQDFFDFLDGFFAGNADFNGVDGTDSQDYFDFIDCFFAGCL